MAAKRTLILGRNYMPIGVFPNLFTEPVEDTIKKYLEGKIHVLEVYDDPVLFKGQPIEHEEKGILFWPSVVVDPQKKMKDAIRLSRSVLFYREHGKCFWCHTELVSPTHVTKDHVIPTSRGGKNDFENVVASCKKCNAEKADHLPVGRWALNGRVVRNPTFFELLNERRKFPIYVEDKTWEKYLPNWAGEVILK